MRRRDFLAAVGAAVLPTGAVAQQPSLPTIGVLVFGSDGLGRAVDAAFHQGLNEQGFRDGQNVEIIYRSTEMYDRLPGLYADFVRQGVALVASMGAGSPALTAIAATATVPVVFLIDREQGQNGVVTGLNRPAGNVIKRLDVLLNLLPTLTSIGYLHNPTVGVAEARIRAVEAAAHARGVQLAIGKARTPGDIQRVFKALVGRKIGALIVGTSPLFIARTEQLTALAAEYGLPAVYPYREQVEAGGLISYGTNISDAWRLAGSYAGRLLKGERAADFPAPQSTRVELAISMKTAKALALTVPAELLGRADKIIE
jgi:putative tryptophan/tyrosine transport system substrate-binding protein